MTMINSYPNVTGFIIAGGKSRRMGFDKRQIRIEGAPLLDRLQRLLQDVLGDEPFLVADNLSPKAGRILHDAMTDSGPLAGLVAALENCPTEWALALAVDLPNLTLNELSLLLNACREGLDALTLASNGQVEPLAALYNVNSAIFWRGRLERRELGLRDGLMHLKCDLIQISNNSRALENINEPWQLSHLQSK
ncbi:MAG: hypothetical protein CO189_07410 [candidate division Zixibacteria bacterium CG_4_9_14_3_um_filter_46_8]|nr:MAG: hypothetical protein CO189_07410 [candidate division Zixibacteria bacterium CG_4_9_14_3_um_filter_46_8]